MLLRASLKLKIDGGRITVSRFAKAIYLLHFIIRPEMQRKGECERVVLSFAFSTFSCGY